MSKRYSGKSFKDSSIMKKPKLTFKEKRKLKEEKKRKDEKIFRWRSNNDGNPINSAPIFIATNTEYIIAVMTPLHSRILFFVKDIVNLYPSKELFYL